MPACTIELRLLRRELRTAAESCVGHDDNTLIRPRIAPKLSLPIDMDQCVNRLEESDCP
jgi:hypothetical protein